MVDCNLQTTDCTLQTAHFTLKNCYQLEILEPLFLFTYDRFGHFLLQFLHPGKREVMFILTKEAGLHAKLFIPAFFQ